MGRNLLIGFILALGIMGGLWFLLRDDNSVAFGPGRSEAPATTLIESEDPSTLDVPVEVAADSEATTETVIEEVDLAAAPLLVGRVTGEGAGIEGATVLLFAVRGIEELLERFEGMASENAGGIPNVPSMISTVKAELHRFRGTAIPFITDEEGVFEVRGAKPGGYLVLALAEGWLFRYGDVVSLDPERTSELDLPLERGASIAGRVVSNSGAGIAGVRVIAEYQPPGMPGVGTIVRRMLKYVNGEFLKGPFERVTAEDGSFDISSLPPGTYDVTAYTEAGLESSVRAVETGTSGNLILFGEGAMVEGLFVGVQGFPVSDVPVKLERIDSLVSLPAPAMAFNGVAGLMSRYLGEGPRETVSGSDGSFRFGPVGAGKYRLIVEEPGYLQLAQEIDLTWGDSYSAGVMRVDRGRSISGMVRAEDGRPLENATIVAIPENVGFMNAGSMMQDFMTGRIQTRSRPDGSFELAGLGRGPFKVRVTRAEYAPADQGQVEPDQEPLEFNLKPGDDLAGVVVSAVDGEPVPGVKVRVGEIRDVTDAEGRFELRGIVEETQQMNPFSMGMMAQARVVRDGEDEQEEQPWRVSARKKGYLEGTVEVFPSTAPAEVRVEITPAPHLSGVVLTPDGQPAPGALVRLTPAIGDMGPFEFFDSGLIFIGVTVADLEGRFSFEEYASAQPGQYRVIADHLSHARGESESFRFDDYLQQASDIEVRLVSGCTIRGTVTDGTSPVAGAIVRLTKSRETGEPGQAMMMRMMGLPKGGKTVHTNSDGEFVYEKVLPDNYEISAEMVGFTESSTLPLNLVAGDDKRADFALDPGRTISGEVLDDQGVRVAGVLVRVLQKQDNPEMQRAQVMMGGGYKSAVTNVEGLYSIPGLPVGRYTLTADKAGYSKSVLEDVYAAKETFQALTLVPAAGVRGQAFDTVTGSPVVSYQVLVRNTEAGMEEQFWRSGGETVDNPDGMFEQDGLEAGTYEVEIRAKGFATGRETVELRPGLVSEVVVELVRAGRVRGRVVDAENLQPVAGAQVYLAVPREPGQSATEKENDERAIREFFGRAMGSDRVTTDDDGYYLIETVPEGVHAIMVSHESFLPKRHERVEVPLSTDVELDLKLNRGLEVSGRVVDASGEPQAYQWIFVRGASAETEDINKSGNTDDQGRFRFSGLAPGTYRVVSAQRGSRGTQGMELTVEEDQDEVEIRLPASD